MPAVSMGEYVRAWVLSCLPCINGLHLIMKDVSLCEMRVHIRKALRMKTYVEVMSEMPQCNNQLHQFFFIPICYGVLLLAYSNGTPA